MSSAIRTFLFRRTPYHCQAAIGKPGIRQALLASRKHPDDALPMDVFSLTIKRPPRGLNRLLQELTLLQKPYRTSLERP